MFSWQAKRNKNTAKNLKTKLGGASKKCQNFGDLNSSIEHLQHCGKPENETQSC